MAPGKESADLHVRSAVILFGTQLTLSVISLALEAKLSHIEVKNQSVLVLEFLLPLEN